MDLGLRNIGCTATDRHDYDYDYDGFRPNFAYAVGAQYMISSNAYLSFKIGGEKVLGKITSTNNHHYNYYTESKLSVFDYQFLLNFTYTFNAGSSWFGNFLRYQNGQQDASINYARGLEFEIGVGYPLNEMAFLYKLNPYFSLGFAFSTYYSDVSGMAKAKIESEKLENGKLDSGNGRFVLRGNYRAFDKALSPLVTIDLGLRKFCYSGGFSWEGHYGGNYYDLYTANCVKMEIALALGASYKIGKNNYVAFKFGMEKPFGKLYYTFIDEYDGTKYKEKIIKYSNRFILLSYTHTLGTGANWFGGKGSNWVIPNVDR